MIFSFLAVPLPMHMTIANNVFISAISVVPEQNSAA
jgi:hypothetical protein